MSFKIVNNLGKESNPKPVINSQSEKVLVVSCKDFTGEISSITGIHSKFLYIPRLVTFLSGLKDLNPTVRIICEEECKDRCMNLKMYNLNGVMVSYKELPSIKTIQERISVSYIRKPDTNELQNINQQDDAPFKP